MYVAQPYERQSRPRSWSIFPFLAQSSQLLFCPCMTFARIAKFGLLASGISVFIALTLILFWGPRMSIEFAGGTLMEVQVPEGKTVDDVKGAIASLKTEEPIANPSVTQIRSTLGTSLILRMRALSNDEHVALLEHLQETVGEVTELKFATIGPSVSASLRRNSLWALGIAAFAIILYLAFSFRKVPRRVSSWKFGVIAVVTCIHDLLIMTGVFVVISRFTSFEMDTLFITALLSIMGYSVNDTIVIFDRIRENLMAENKRRDFEELVTQSLKQTLLRTLNTGTGALIMLLMLTIFGAESIRWFTLALIIGTIVGTYSSFFVAAPMLMVWRGKNDDRR